MISKKITEVRRKLRERQSLEENKHNLEEQKFIEAILDLIDEMDKERAKGILEDLPTIETSEDCISRKWVLNEIVTKVEDDASLTDEQKGSLSAAKYLIRHAPPVVPSRAEGECVEDEYGIPRCKECNCINNTVYRNYCPNCGAQMKGADDESVDSN